MIIIEPIGGLANRMRVLDSICELIGDSDQKVILLWRLNPSLNCQFRKLFYKPKNFIIINIHNKSFFGNRFYRHVWEKISSALFYMLDIQEISKRLRDQEALKKLIISSKKTVYIKTFSRFYDMNYAGFQLKPQKFIQNEVERIVDLFNDQKVVGVHVRRGDHSIAIENSPIIMFKELITREISTDPEVNFFLATDSEEVEEDFKNIFGDKIFTQSKVVNNRNSPICIQQALIDLLCLARCESIIGSYFSSFSQLAARINSINLVVAKEDLSKI